MNFAEKDHAPYEGEDLQRYIDKMLAVEKPSSSLVKWSNRLLKTYFDPELIDADKLPDRPCLFVANHSVFAVDGPVLSLPLLAEHGRWLRALSDKALWMGASENTLLKSGIVLGHPEVCSALMEAGNDLLVFPGGSHEATKPEAQKYTLQWKQRTGFVRMAAEHGYCIVPTAIVGPEEFYSHLVEGEELPNSLFGRLLGRLGVLDENTRSDLMPPIPTGLLGSVLPKPQKCYIQFGEAVDLADYRGTTPSAKQQYAIRDKVAGSIEQMLLALLRRRTQEKPRQRLWRRLLTA